MKSLVEGMLSEIFSRCCLGCCLKSLVERGCCLKSLVEGMLSEIFSRGMLSEIFSRGEVV